MKEFFLEIDLHKPSSPTENPSVSDEDLKRINSLNKNGPLKKLGKDEINTRSIIIMGEEPTSKGSIHPEGIFNNRKVNSLSSLAKLLPGCPMMVGHRMDKTPWGRTFKAELLDNQPGYKGKAVKEAFWFLNDDEGNGIARKIDAGIWAEGSISYWFTEARCSICHKPMASLSFLGTTATIPRCKHKLGQKDPETGQICYYYPYGIKAVAETSYVFKGAYPKTKSFLTANPDALAVAYSHDQIEAAKALETQLVDCGLDLDNINLSEDINDTNQNQTIETTPQTGTAQTTNPITITPQSPQPNPTQAKQHQPHKDPTQPATDNPAATQHSPQARGQEDTHTDTSSQNTRIARKPDGKSNEPGKKPGTTDNTPDRSQPTPETDDITNNPETGITHENNSGTKEPATTEDLKTTPQEVENNNPSHTTPSGNGTDTILPNNPHNADTPTDTDPTDKLTQPEELERGKGKGKGGKPQGDGGASKCVCEKCGYEIEHKKGTPCNEQKCPKCNIPLVGKNADTQEIDPNKTQLSRNNDTNETQVSINNEQPSQNRDGNPNIATVGPTNIPNSQESDDDKNRQPDALAFFSTIAAEIDDETLVTEVQAVIMSDELDFDERETALRELLPVTGDLLVQGLALLSSMRLSASAVDDVLEGFRFCADCEEDYAAAVTGDCTACGGTLSFLERHKAVLFRPVGPLKPKKAGAQNNEFFKQEAFRDLPDGTYFVEPKYDGVWMELHKKGGDVKLYSDEGNEYSAKFPQIVAEAKALQATNFIVAGEMTRWRGRQRLTHTDVTAWIHSKQESYDDKEFKFKPFDMMMFLGQDITGQLLDVRRKRLDAVIKWGKQIHPTAHRVVNHKTGDAKVITAINDRKTREGAMVKNVSAKYSKPDQKLLYKWKQQYEVDAKVAIVKDKKGGGFLYSCEVGRGKNVRPIGDTFATKIKAAVGQIIQVSVDHIRYDKENDRYSWFAPKVIALRSDKRLPDPLSTIKKMARVTGSEPKSKNLITLTEIIPRLKRAAVDVELYLTGGLVEEGMVTHDIDIITRDELSEDNVTAILDALGPTLAPYVDFTYDPEGPAGPNIPIVADMKATDAKWKYATKFVLQEHGWGKKVHWDIRFGAPRTKRMWGWTLFSMPPTAAGAKKTRCQEKKYHDPKWMGVDTKKIPPGEPGNPTKNLNAWMKKIDTGSYEYIKRKPKFLELILHGTKLKGRYIWREIEVKHKSEKDAAEHRITGDEVGTKTDKIWIMWKPQDQETSAPVKKLGYRISHGCLFFWETEEIDTELDAAPDVSIENETAA